MSEYDLFIERFLELVGVQRVSMVVHDWGAAGLLFAQRHPERVARLVVINAVPLLEGYRWHRIARIWRTPLLGELAMGTVNRRTLRFASRESNATPGPMPQAWQDSVLEHFDHGTQRAILKLYRSASPAALAAAGEALGAIEAPALVLWGKDDPFLPPSYAHALAERFGGAADVEVVDDARHWPWLDRPELVDRVADFLAGKP